MTPVKANTIAAALGKSYEHQDVHIIVQNFSISKIPRAKPDDPISNLLSKKDGIELGFIDSDYLLGKDVARYGNGDMIFYQAVMYAAGGEPGYKEYKGELPGGGKIGDSLTEHISRLGPPTDIVEDEGEIISRLWLLDGYWLSFAYNWKKELRFAGLILGKYRSLMQSKKRG
jgi:hypothetical protein